MSRLFFDIRYSLRKFVREPWLALALLLTIALGVGSNVCVYGFILGLTKSDLPLASVDRMVAILGQDAHREDAPLTRAQYLWVERCTGAFEWVGAARVTPGVLEIDHQSQIVSLANVTPDLAKALGLPQGAEVVIGQRIYENEAAAGPGEQILINGVKARVSGIAPRKLEGLYRDHAVDVWMPLEERALQLVDQGTRDFWVVARLRRGVSIQRAQDIVRESSGDGPRVAPYTGMKPEMAAGLSRIGNLLRFAAFVVFSISCTNVISFLLGRAFSRAHETSLRVALGASRSQLARQLFWDSVVIAVAGGASGLLLAVWTLHVIPALLFQQDADRLAFVLPPSSIVAICAACISVIIVCGSVPIFVTSDARPVNVLRRESAGPSKAIQRVRMGLVLSLIHI